MKDNMVQELLLRAILNAQPNTQQPPEAFSRQGLQTQRGIMQNGDKAQLDALLKSLYLNNAQKMQAYNTNNTINSKQPVIPQNSKNALQMQRDLQPQHFEEFIQQDPEFFKGREVLFDYLTQCGSGCDSEELTKIAQIARALEEQAIKRFCAKNPRYAQFLQQENSKTLNKLENTANTGFGGDLKTRPSYTAEQILAMSNDEFLKNEQDINAQLSELLKNR